MKVHCSVCKQETSVSSQGLIPTIVEDIPENLELNKSGGLPYDIYDLKDHLEKALPEWVFVIQFSAETAELFIKCFECLQGENPPISKKGKKKKSQKILKKISKLLNKLGLLLD